MKFCLCFLATLKQHGLVLFNVEDDESHFWNQECGKPLKQAYKAFMDYKLSTGMAQMFEQREAVVYLSFCHLVSKLWKEHSEWKLAFQMVNSGFL